MPILSTFGGGSVRGFCGAAGGGEGFVTDQLHWHVDAANPSSYSGSGTTWTDLISGQNATLINSPAYSTSSANGGGAFFFDGANDYATTNLQKTQSDFSVSAWHKPSTHSNSGQHSIMNSFESTSSEWWALSTQGAGRGNPIWIIDNDSNKVQFQSTTEAADSWQMITGTRSGSTIKLYVNDVLTGTLTSLTTSVVVGIEPFWIASRSGGATEMYKGYLSDLKIYTKELSASEVSENYNALKDRYGL